MNSGSTNVRGCLTLLGQHLGVHVLLQEGTESDMQCMGFMCHSLPTPAHRSRSDQSACIHAGSAPADPPAGTAPERARCQCALPLQGCSIQVCTKVTQHGCFTTPAHCSPMAQLPSTACSCLCSPCVAAATQKSQPEAELTRESPPAPGHCVARPQGQTAQPIQNQWP